MQGDGAAWVGGRAVALVGDALATTWTITRAFEVDSLDPYLDLLEGRSKRGGLGFATKGFTDFVGGGKRETFKVASL